MVRIKQNTSVVDVALNLSGSITGLPAVVDQLPVGNRVGFSSGWEGNLGPALSVYGDPKYLRDILRMGIFHPLMIHCCFTEKDRMKYVLLLGR